MKTVCVNTSTPYTVSIGEGFLSEVGKMLSQIKTPCRTAIISDDKVYPLYGETVKVSLENAGFSVASYTFPNGEASKNLHTLGDILEFLACEHLTRTDLIVALGGGVVGDMAGFASAIFLRGMDFVQIPTSLLAAVDSSVGGKTAIDLSGGKNLAGAFHQPIGVICDTDTFQTLDNSQISCGMAEVIKYGVICDRAFFEVLENGMVSYADMVETCVKIKRDIVERDEFDNGERKLLNLGHTLGHAVEKHSNFAFTHGAAVAVGMRMIALISEKAGFAQENLSDRLCSIFEKYGLPTTYPISVEELFALTCGDKKTEGKNITPVFPVSIGACILKKMPLTEWKTLIPLALDSQA